MTKADDAILEFLLNDPNPSLVATPGMVEMNIGYSNSTVKARIRELMEAGLVDYADESRGFYRITEKGRAYLRGDLEKSDLERNNG